MKSHIANKFKKVPVAYLSTAIILLSAFGVYLGRFLRYNSWEILSQPKKLFSEILNMIVHPYDNYEVWLFTLSFGAFLYVSFRMFNKLYSPST